MKKIFTLLAALLVGGTLTASAAKTFDQVFPADFSRGIPEGWAFLNDATTEQVDGGIKVTCSQTAPKYRADLKYNMPTEKADNYCSLNASDYKVIAIQFIGKRPESGALKMSNIAILDGEKSSWIKNAEGYSLKESAWTDIQDINGNHTYYWTIGGDNWTGEKTLTKIEIVIADITNEADKSYTVAWVNWFKDEDDLKAHLNLDAVTLYDANGDKKAGYVGLKEAVDASVDGEKIIVNADVTVTDRIGLNKKITILGTEGVNVNFARTDKAAFLATEGEVATLKNLNLVYANTNASGSINPSESKFLEANKGGMIVEDCVIKNFETSHDQGVIAAMNGGRFTLKNVTLENCKVPENRGEIFFGANNSVVDGTTNGSIFVEKSYTFKADSSFDPAPRVAAEALDADVVPAANTVKVYTDAHTIGSPVVEGTADPAKFELNNTAWELEAKDGKLVIKEKQSVGIAGVEADENAPVEYFNLNGVQVKADNMTPGVYVRRQGKNVTKVMVK